MGDGEKSSAMSKNKVFDFCCEPIKEYFCEMFDKKCKIASEEGETSSAMVPDEVEDADHETFNTSRKATMEDFCKMVPKIRKISSEEGETSSAMVPDEVLEDADHETFNMEDFCEMLPKNRKISAEKGETSSAMSKNVYEVFLSFRGPDTRQGFTDCLYHAMVDAGITVFRDDDELRPGDKLVEILTALDNSKLCVVVFSRTFAASSWCLREVERMVEMKKEIVPIFVDVTPDDVKLKTPLYEDVLTVHETKYKKEQVQQWREALREIPKIKGRELKNSGFGGFSRQLVKEILTKLKLKNKYEIPELVEVPDEVEDALKLLHIESRDERRFLGIHGMGGMGKTTLAKIVFNKISDSFDCSCFLENVRDGLSQGQDGLTKMQEKLLKSLNPSSGNIKKNFTNKKVLIVLDDIDEKSQIHSLVGDSGWFGLGSRIIFTTRKARLHEQVSSSNNATFQGLEKEEMNSKQALELFSKHAFGQDSPPEDFKDLSNKVISVTSGLPLALEVVGSFLCRQKAKVWRSTIKKLKEAPAQDVQRKLRLSYDALEPEQQEIFLDIACFFINRDKKYAVYMWEACDFYPDHNIEVLISMSLIKITSRKEEENFRFWVYKKCIWVYKKCFWMHDQLRDMGRVIVNEKYGDPRAGSRLWVAEDALDQLRRNLGKERIDAVQLMGSPTITLDREDFVDLKKLRFLEMSWITNVSRDFSGLVPKLRWLSLSNISFNATNLCLKELAVLELKECKLQVNWSQFLMSEKLKALTISECNELTSMPDLSNLVNLERLEFLYCNNMASIHSSLWKLRYLKHLSLKFAGSLMSHCNLPESIGHLVCLTKLILFNMGFTKLPENIGELVKLKHMLLFGCGALKVIPESIGRLTKLESLDLLCCSSLHSLPNSMGSLRSLIVLNLISSGIAELPNSIGDLASLQHLDLSYTGGGDGIIGYVHDLPIGLTSLRIGWVQKIQLSYLINLSYLGIDTDFDPTRIRQSSPDQHMVIEGIEKLSKLERLNIMSSIGISLSMELSALQYLKSLTLNCQNFEFGQCQLPSSLESLSLKVKDWGELLLNLPSLKNLSNLILYNYGADEVKGRMEHESGYAKSVCMDLSALKKLKSLSLIHSKLEFRQCQLPSSLESLRLEVKDWGELLNLPSLKNLSKLEVKGRMEHKEGYAKSVCMDLSALKKLKSLSLIHSKLEFRQCQLPSSLESLVLTVQWGQLPTNISSLKNLSTLCLTNFLMDPIDEIGGLESLEWLRLSGCEFPSKCLDISQLDRLESVSINRAAGLVEISGNGKLEKLSIRNCMSFERMEDISKLNGLKEICIENCMSFQRMEDSSKLNGLKQIHIENCSNFLGIDDIESVFYAQTMVDIWNCKCEDFYNRPSSV